MALDLITIATSLLLLATCTGTARPGRDAWQRARTVAESYLKATYGDPPAWRIIDEHEGTPFLFAVRTPETFAVLVHNDEVFTQRGLGGLDRYLRESRCVELRTTNIKEMMVLLRLLETLPPWDRADDYIWHRTPVEALRPRLAFHDGGRGTLHLFYASDATGDGDTSDDDDESDGDDEEDRIIIEWTLTMNPGQAPFWTRANRHWNDERNAFTDADHKN